MLTRLTWEKHFQILPFFASSFSSIMSHITPKFVEIFRKFSCNQSRKSEEKFLYALFDKLLELESVCGCNLCKHLNVTNFKICRTLLFCPHFISRNQKSPNEWKVYIVTVKHILGDSYKRFYLTKCRNTLMLSKEASLLGAKALDRFNTPWTMTSLNVAREKSEMISSISFDIVRNITREN